jgi:CRP-like cAMP-binding protein
MMKAVPNLFFGGNPYSYRCLEGLMAIHKNAKVSGFLREVDLFEGMDNKVHNQIFKLGLVQNFQKGDLIIREGQPGGKLHVLINGKAEVVKAVKGKAKGQQLAQLQKGSVFGEMSVFDGAPYSASVRAIEDCDVHIVRGSDFEAFLQQNSKAAYGIFRTLISSISNRLRRTNMALSAMGK